MEQIKFYGRTSNPKYWPFSNFYVAPFTDSAGNTWQTTEHYFQAMKFLPEDVISVGFKQEKPLRQYINGLPTPGAAAKEGRRRDLPLRADWESVKDSYMYKALYHKFTQHEDLKWLLLDTGDLEIVEDSPIDYYWGCGKSGSGKNMLGQLLVKLRQALRAEINKEKVNNLQKPWSDKEM